MRNFLAFIGYKTIILIIIVISIFLSAYWQRYRHLAGDEPHYLTITHSIAYDGDIALKNNYDRQDYQNFYDQSIATGDRHISPNSILRGNYSLHNIGLPLILVPGYVLGKRSGVTLTLYLICIFEIFLFARILKKITDKISALPILLVFLTMPMIIYSHIITHELVASCTVLLFFYQLFFCNTNNKSKYQILSIGLLLAFLPWLHIKYIFLLFFLLIIVLFNSKDKFQFLYYFLMSLLSSLGLLFFLKIFYGDFSLVAQYPAEYSSLVNLIKGFFGLLIDESFGIFVFSPILLLTPAAIYFSYKYKQAFLIWSLFLIFATTVVNSLYANKIGWSPAGRMWVVVIPVVFVWFIYLYKQIKHIVTKRIFRLFSFLSIAIGVLCSLVPPISYNTGEQNRIFMIIEKATYINLSVLFPKLLAITDYLPQTNGWVMVGWIDWLKTFLWIVAIAVLNFYIIKKNTYDYRH